MGANAVWSLRRNVAKGIIAQGLKIIIGRLEEAWNGNGSLAQSSETLLAALGGSHSSPMLIKVDSSVTLHEIPDIQTCHVFSDLLGTRAHLFGILTAPLLSFQSITDWEFHPGDLARANAGTTAGTAAFWNRLVR